MSKCALFFLCICTQFYLQVFKYRTDDSTDHLGIVEIIPGNHCDPRHLFFIFIVYPQAESRKGGGNSRNPEGQALQGSIAPGFVIGREKGQIKPNQCIVIGEIKYPIVSIQIGRNKYDLYPVFLCIVQTIVPYPVQDLIVLFVMQIVCKMLLT